MPTLLHAKQTFLFFTRTRSEKASTSIKLNSTRFFKTAPRETWRISGVYSMLEKIVPLMHLCVTLCNLPRNKKGQTSVCRRKYQLAYFHHQNHDLRYTVVINCVTILILRFNWQSSKGKKKTYMKIFV